MTYRGVNALAEAFNSLFKAELVRNKRPWKDTDDLEVTVTEYVDWFDRRRLNGQAGLIPPVELEDTYYRRNPAPTTVSASVPRLHWTRHETVVGECERSLGPTSCHYRPSVRGESRPARGLSARRGAGPRVWWG